MLLISRRLLYVLFLILAAIMLFSPPSSDKLEHQWSTEGAGTHRTGRNTHRGLTIYWYISTITSKGGSEVLMYPLD